MLFMSIGEPQLWQYAAWHRAQRQSPQLPPGPWVARKDPQQKALTWCAPASEQVDSSGARGARVSMGVGKSWRENSARNSRRELQGGPEPASVAVVLVPRDRALGLRLLGALGAALQARRPAHALGMQRGLALDRHQTGDGDAKMCRNARTGARLWGATLCSTALCSAPGRGPKGCARQGAKKPPEDGQGRACEAAGRGQR